MSIISLLISPYPPQQKIPPTLLNTLLHHYSSYAHSLSPYSENTSILLPISLNISFSTSHIKFHILESNTSHHYNLSSNSNIIHLPSYISLIHLIKYPYISLILLCILQITNAISHKTSISFTISILFKRYQTLTLKPFSYKAQILLTKTLLMEGTNLS